MAFKLLIPTKRQTFLHNDMVRTSCLIVWKLVTEESIDARTCGNIKPMIAFFIVCLVTCDNMGLF